MTEENDVRKKVLFSFFFFSFFFFCYDLFISIFQNLTPKIKTGSQKTEKKN